jgi:glutamate-5-semialdehyde dehydrogenase
MNAKTDKISACNALDKVLLDDGLPKVAEKTRELVQLLAQAKVEVLVTPSVGQWVDAQKTTEEEVWYEEFLSKKILIGNVSSLEGAVEMINTYSGHHSSVIMTESPAEATQFMEQVDSAAVYHNASSRFTDGGQMGVGAELAISTDKLHHRGPLGLKQLVSNKYWVYGDGHVRV